MKPLCITRHTRVSVLALIVSALSLAPSFSQAQDLGLRQSGVRFIGELNSFGPQAAPGVAAPTPIKLGDFERGPVSLGLTLTPHGSISAMPGGERASGGAMLRLNATPRGDRPEDGSWFLFAGAKGQAVSWDMSSDAFNFDDFAQLKQRETVGDFQMGVGYQMGDAQVSFGLMRQTYKVSTSYRRTYTDRQDIAGMSIAWRH